MPRAHMGMPPIEHERVYSYVGNGAPVLIRRVLGADATEAQVQEGAGVLLGVLSRPHAGLYGALSRCARSARPAARRGKAMAVLTNKPVNISRAIVKGLGVGGHFRQVYGGNSFDFKKPHPIGVETLIGECGVDREHTMMVGDSSVDIQTARNAHVKSCGVTYGFQPDTLRTVPPDLLVDRMEDLADWVIG
jgi:phosphoglycolate phosphatase